MFDFHFLNLENVVSEMRRIRNWRLQSKLLYEKIEMIKNVILIRENGALVEIECLTKRP